LSSWSLTLNFIFKAKLPQGDDSTVPENVKGNLEEFTKEQIQVCDVLTVFRKSILFAVLL
jgi:hypothetical protein